MVETSSRIRLKYVVATLWLLFTLSFALWWMYFGLHQIRLVAELLPAYADEFLRHRRMMVWEGAAWMILLLSGGATLIWFVAREARRARELKGFFAAFSHDVKTSLASLRLQAECLKEDLAGRELPVLDRLVADTVRLHLQLQNSLFLASSEDLKLHMENLSLDGVIKDIQPQWPQVTFRLEKDCVVHADERAMQSILSNLVHNAVVHGGAHEFKLAPKPLGAGKVAIHFADDGTGFAGDSTLLGKLFYRHSPRSGSGVGLYICRSLIERMNGILAFSGARDGFSGRFELEGHLS